MAERTEMDPFEERLVDLVLAYTQPAATPVDPLGTARTAMRAGADARAGWVRRWWSVRDPRLLALMIAAVLLVALTALAIAAGSRLTSPTRTLGDDGTLVFARNGDLFTSRGDGTGAVRIRGGDGDGNALGYLAALWSPDARHIAAVRDVGGPGFTPVVEIMAIDGSNIQRVDLEPGGMPSLSWSPDAGELAVASYPATVARNADVPVEGGIRLRLARVDGGTHEIALPADARFSASAAGELWTAPGMYLQWSPDGRWIALATQSDPGGSARWLLVATDGAATRDLSSVTLGQCGSPGNWIDWYPDGRHLATVSADGATLCVLDVLSNGAAIAGPGPTPIAEVQQDPFTEPHAKLLVPVVAPGGDRIAASVWTSDFANGRQVNALRVFDLASGQWRDVAGGVMTLDISGGGVRGSAPADGTPVFQSGVSWTPDGSGLLFLTPESARGSDGWTLRAVIADGGEASTAVLEHIRSFDVTRTP
jgi:hypothetical protein